MMKASEARELMKPSVEEQAGQYISYIEERIGSCAKCKAHALVLRQPPYADWAYGDKYKNDPVGLCVFTTLREAGYTVSTHYNEGMFVDYGMKISW